MHREQGALTHTAGTLHASGSTAALAATSAWRAGRVLVAVLGGLLASIVLVQAGLSWGVILQPEEGLYGEAMVYDHAARILRGEALYQPLDRPPYSVAAYTPLYYLLAAVLQAALGPGFAPGRGLSFLAGLLTAGLVAYLVTARTRDRWAGGFAALLFLALGLPLLYLWSALYRVDMVGVTLAIGAVTALSGGVSTRRVVLAACLAALAMLTKQTLLAASLAGAIWLWRHDRRCSVLFVSIVLMISLGTFLALEIVTGAFFANTVAANVNPFSRDSLVTNLAVLVQFQAGPLAVAALYLWERVRAHPKSNDDLLVWYWAASFLPVAGLAKVGSSQNYWIELAAATAVLATLGIWGRLSEKTSLLYGNRPAIVPILLLSVTLAVVTPGVWAVARAGFGEPWSQPTHAGEFERLVERVRAETGEVLAEPLDVVVLAGRPILFEPTIFGILYSQGRWNSDPLIRRICAGEVGLLILGQPLEGVSGQYHRYNHWTAPVLSALRQVMVPDSQQAGRFVYARRPSTLDASCSVSSR